MKKSIPFYSLLILFLSFTFISNPLSANPTREVDQTKTSPHQADAEEKTTTLAPMIDALMIENLSEDLSFGFLVQDLHTGKIIYSKNAELLLNPASNTKILTALAALSLLGPDYVFKTQLLALPSPEKSTLHTLTLRGLGDPTFNSNQLQNMVHQLKEKGIQKIDQIFIDGSYFDNTSFPGQFEGRQKDAFFNCSVGALSIDHNILEIVVSPEEKIGKKAKVETSPPLTSFPIQSEVSTLSKNRRIIVKNNPESEEDLSISVSGAIALKSESQSFKISVHHPLQLAGLHLIQALKNEGIQAPDHAEVHVAPFGSLPLIESKSPPLLQILQDMNKQSDNFIAEQITKFLGAKFAGTPGTTAKGTQVILKKLKELGISTEGLVLENGSGLSRMNRMSVQSLSQLLSRTYKDISLRGNFISTLSVLGVDGTLRKKFRNSSLAGRFFGKTGTLNGVSALSGYIFPKSYEENHHVYAYTFILNGNGKNFWKQKQIFQDVLELLLHT